MSPTAGSVEYTGLETVANLPVFVTGDAGRAGRLIVPVVIPVGGYNLLEMKVTVPSVPLMTLTMGDCTIDRLR